MRIDSSDGSLSFSAGCVKPDQGKSAFLGTQLGAASKVALVNEDWTQLDIRPEEGIAGTILYKGERLNRVLLLMLIPSDDSDEWTEDLERQRKAKHDLWLHTELGEPPYEFPWGSITSEYDQKGCVSEIIVSYAK